METKTPWIKRWAGSYTFISCSYWASQYSTTLKRILGRGFDNVLFIHKKGTASFFVKRDEFEAFGRFLADKTVCQESEALELLKKLKENTDALLGIMEELEGNLPAAEQYAGFYPIFEKHLAYHNFMKKTVDFIPSKLLEKLLPHFQDARIYSESVYSRTEQFFRSWAKTIAEKEKYSLEALTCLTQGELEEYIRTGMLPSEDTLCARFESSAIVWENGTLKICTGSEAVKLETDFFPIAAHDITGTVAFKGNIKGICRIIHDPFQKHQFNQGDILVTGMTRPEFLPFLKKAGAIITDAGGLLCHAAITAREMKIPCIVGTEHATRILHEGDLLEVDAEQGIVRQEAFLENKS